MFEPGPIHRIEGIYENARVRMRIPQLEATVPIAIPAAFAETMVELPGDAKVFQAEPVDLPEGRVWVVSFEANSASFDEVAAFFKTSLTKAGFSGTDLRTESLEYQGVGRRVVIAAEQTVGSKPLRLRVLVFIDPN